MREDNNFYLPILKAKTGELKALAILDVFTKDHIFPLLEVTPMEWDPTYKTKPKTIEEHLDKFSKKVSQCWAFNACLIDTSLIGDRMSGELSCIEYIFDKLYTSGMFGSKALPTFEVGSPENIIIGVKNITAIYKIEQAGLRITLDGLTNPAFKVLVDQALEKTGFTPESIHLVLDLKEPNLSQTEDYSDAIVAAMEDFPYLSQWKSFTICGGAFPSSSDLYKNENIVPRYDWKLFGAIRSKLKKETYYRDLNYGDYAIVYPVYFEFNNRFMSPSVSIKYTIDDDWLVIKGDSVKKSGTGQYLTQAKQVVQSQYFLGRDYSKGDLHIDNCAKGRIGAGSPTIWNWVANNHHFTKVVSDLFSSLRGS
jgi:Beta protein